MRWIIFTLTSARSGTLFLKSLFKHNVKNCTSRHEPFFDFGNPTLFGPAIYDAFKGRRDQIRKRLEKKSRYINRLKSTVYIESSHAFLKSAYLAALEVFPELGLIHLIRDPLKVAKSEANREDLVRRFHFPFHYYKAEDGGRYFCWSLTGKEEIYRSFNLSQLSLFQRYLIQWIEIENRAMRFLEEHHLHDRCFTLQSPAGLNNPEKIRALFDFFELETQSPEIRFKGWKNRTPRAPTVITPQDEMEAEAVLTQIPEQHLHIFSHPPYTQFPWAPRLQKSAGDSPTRFRNV